MDQDACTRPDTSAPFASKQDAVKRLIRYHCMYEEQREDEEEQGDDGSFRGMAAEFPVIYQNMLNKYQLLLMQESMVSDLGRGVRFENFFRVFCEIYTKYRIFSKILEFSVFAQQLRLDYPKFRIFEGKIFIFLLFQT